MQSELRSDRPSRHLNDAVREVDLPASSLRTWNQLEQGTSAYSSRTLVKQPGLRVLFVAMEKGALIPEHRTTGDVTLQVLSGRVRITVSGVELELPRGRLLAIAAELPHDLLALDASEVLLTIGAP